MNTETTTQKLIEPTTLSEPEPEPEPKSNFDPSPSSKPLKDSVSSLKSPRETGNTMVIRCYFDDKFSFKTLRVFTDALISDTIPFLFRRFGLHHEVPDDYQLVLLDPSHFGIHADDSEKFEQESIQTSISELKYSDRTLLENDIALHTLKHTRGHWLDPTKTWNFYPYICDQSFILLRTISDTLNIISDDGIIPLEIKNAAIPLKYLKRHILESVNYFSHSVFNPFDVGTDYDQGYFPLREEFTLLDQHFPHDSVIAVRKMDDDIPDDMEETESTDDGVDDSIYRLFIVIPKKTGHLLKRGAIGLHKGFKNRYFSLDKDIVSYSKTPETEIIGKISLESVIAVLKITEKKFLPVFKQSSLSSSFQIITPNRIYLLIAESVEEVEDWIRKLETSRQIHNNSKISFFKPTLLKPYLIHVE